MGVEIPLSRKPYIYLHRYGEYAYKASRQGGMGLTWDIIANDPLCGMSTSLIVHAVTTPCS